MKSNLASYSRRLIATAAIVCLSSPIARATVLVNIPFNYTGTLPQSLNSFNSVSLNGASGITGNFSSANAGSLTAGAALSYSARDGGAISAGASGLALASPNRPAVAYSSLLGGQTLYVRFLYYPAASTNRFILSLDDRIDNNGNNTGTVNSPQSASPYPRSA